MRRFRSLANLVMRKEHRSRWFFVLAVLLLTVSVSLFPDVALAQETKELETAEKIFLVLASLVMGFVNFLGKLIALITEVVLVNLMTYNGFGSSSVIGAGWAIVRDVMNMGFVIVLILIAVVTIFGGHVGSWTVKWSHEIPKLLLFAILINFSRTICVFLIDIGQVVMLTFANAIKDIAGGNILQVFGLSDFLSLDTQALQQLIDQNQGLSAFNLFTSAMLALVMSLAVFGTMLILTIVLVYRIVMLWVLVVLSPLAFFFGGAEILSKAAGNPYKDWWARFTGAVAIGPVLIFFLWLTLSVAGSGNIAATEGFPMGAPSDALGDVDGATGFATKIAEPGRLLSFIIGMGMLYAGFEAATKFADVLPGSASNLVKGGVKGALKLGSGATIGVGVAGAKLAAKGGLVAGKVGMMAGGAALAKVSQTQFGQKARGAIGQALVRGGGKLGAVGLLGTGAAGRAMARVGSSLEQARHEDAAARMKEQGKTVEHYDKENIDAELTSKAIGPDAVARQQAMRYRILTDSTLREKYSQEALKQTFEDFKANGGEDTVHGDHDMHKAYKALKKSRPDLLSDADRKEAFSKMSDEEFLAMDAEAFRDDHVREEAKKRSRFETRARRVLDENGDFKIDKDGREVWESGQVDFYTLMAADKIGSRQQRKIFKEAEGGLLASAKLVQDNELRNLPASKQTPEFLRELEEAGRLDTLMSSPGFRIQSLDADFVRNNANRILQKATPEKVQELMDSANGGAFHEGITKQLQDRVFEVDAAKGGQKGVAERSKKMELDLRVAMVQGSGGSKGIEGLTGGYLSGTDKFLDNGKEAFAEAVKRDPSFLRNYVGDIKKDGAIAEVALENLQVPQLTRLTQAYRASKGSERTEFTELLDTLSDKIQAQLDAAEASNNQKEMAKLEPRLRQLIKALVEETA